MLITITEEEYKEFMELKRLKNKMVCISEERHLELIEIENKYNSLFSLRNVMDISKGRFL